MERKKMKIAKYSFILLIMLTVLLMNRSPALAKVTRVYFYQPTGSEEICFPMLEPPHLSGPNIHLQGTWSCPTQAFTMDNQPFPMFTWVITWTDCQAQVVSGKTIYQAKIRIDTVEGGAWVGTLAGQPPGF
jgi:hypothetical protein